MVATTTKRCKKSHNKPNSYMAAATLKMWALLECVTLEMKAPPSQRRRWSKGSVLPLSTQVRGFKPGRSRQDFSGRKNSQHAFPRRRFATCERSVNETWKSTFRQNYLPTFSPTVPPFAARISRVLWTWRHLAAEEGTSKNYGGWGTRVAQ
jgi:hypothetical protein